MKYRIESRKRHRDEGENPHEWIPVYEGFLFDDQRRAAQQAIYLSRSDRRLRRTVAAPSVYDNEYRVTTIESH